MNTLVNHELDELYGLTDFNGESEVPKEPFAIKSLDTANWAFRKLTALQTAAAENAALAEAEHARINAWLESQTGKTKRQMEFFEALLTEYFIIEREKDSHFKLSTPYGRITTRKGDKWTYDEAALVQSLKNAGLDDFIKMTELPDKSAIKSDKSIFVVTDTGQLATVTGAIIGGVSVVKGETITVKAG
jgi:hypothetical protein